MSVLTLDTTDATATQVWIPACASASLAPERGVAILLPDGSQAALFRTFDGNLYAIDNIDPFSNAAVMARGIVGDRGGEPTVASPMLKQVFSLRSGVCFDDTTVRQTTYPVRERDGVIEIATGSKGGTS
ncbi:nitrite reductase small subunit NirD [Salinactinospora qingdaonensis]|uniref:Nitrite reductase small subunit NirD n=1 Tax=Salinactinospora qingdaonensis TaxID=702744 RepID=A0ABP7GH31_9ACTN